MNNKNLDWLKAEYMDIPIPDELDFVVRKALKSSRANTTKKKAIIRGSVAAAALVVVLTAGVNSSQTFAKTLSELPVVGSIAKVLTFREYTVDQDKYKADIKVPAVSGLENKSLEKSLNEKYLNEGKQLYEGFMADMKKIKENGGGNLGVSSGYVVKTDTDSILSIGRYVVNTVGSSSTTFKYDTIDKKKEVLITLPMLFKDDRYIGVISENIKKQMVEQMKSDSKKVYWVTVEGSKSNMKPFDKISGTQNFYINAEGKLVVSFNKYEVAPGAMGIVEFVIPTNVISDILVGSEYIK